MDDNASPLERLADATGLSVFDLAQMLDTTPAVVEAWLAGVIQPSLRAREGFHDMLAVFDAAFSKMTADGARRWLVSESAALDGEAPADLMRRGDAGAVLDLLNALPRALRARPVAQPV